MRLIADDEYELSSGRRFYAHQGIIGIAPNDATLFDGYDGFLEESIALKPKEKHEIADFMIKLWTEYKAGQPLIERIDL